MVVHLVFQLAADLEARMAEKKVYYLVEWKVLMLTEMWVFYWVESMEALLVACSVHKKLEWKACRWVDQ